MTYGSILNRLSKTLRIVAERVDTVNPDLVAKQNLEAIHAAIKGGEPTMKAFLLAMSKEIEAQLEETKTIIVRVPVTTPETETTSNEEV